MISSPFIFKLYFIEVFLSIKKTSKLTLEALIFLIKFYPNLILQLTIITIIDNNHETYYNYNKFNSYLKRTDKNESNLFK